MIQKGLGQLAEPRKNRSMTQHAESKALLNLCESETITGPTTVVFCFNKSSHDCRHPEPTAFKRVRLPSEPPYTGSSDSKRGVTRPIKMHP